jgi:hypothetical protein
MPDTPWRLYDENIVHAIMRSTGHTVIEYLRENGIAGADEVTDFVEVNFDEIIGATIRELRRSKDVETRDHGEDDLPAPGL